MNKLDKDYLALLQDILDNGTKKETRNGDTISVFGRQIRHKMSDGFPLLTTKKMYFKGIVTELLWFLRGDTNIKFLLDNDCHIWDGDAYKNYVNKIKLQNNWAVTLKSMNVDTIGQQELLTKEEFITTIKINHNFAEKWGDLGQIYGKQWRKWKSNYWTPKAWLNETGEPVVRGENNIKLAYSEIDQIANLIRDLKTNPDSRRLMVNAWNVGELDQMILPPCHYGFQVYTRELNRKEKVDWVLSNCYETGMERYSVEQMTDEQFHNDYFNVPKRAISLMWNQRSVDTFLGLPFNIASYGLLLEIIAKAVNMVPDELIGNLGDCHLYLSDHVEAAKEQINREPYPLPKLNINTEFWQTEGGECGVGPLDAVKVFESFKDDNFCKCLLEEDIQLSNYQSHPTIKAPLSN